MTLRHALLPLALALALPSIAHAARGFTVQDMAYLDRHSSPTAFPLKHARNHVAEIDPDLLDGGALDHLERRRRSLTHVEIDRLRVETPCAQLFAQAIARAGLGRGLAGRLRRWRRIAPM